MEWTVPMAATPLPRPQSCGWPNGHFNGPLSPHNVLVGPEDWPWMTRLVPREETAAELPDAAGGRAGPRAFREEARNEWVALGPLGRTVLIALTMSAFVVVALALVIPIQVERHLTDGASRTQTRIAEGFAQAGLIPLDPNDSEALADIDSEMRLTLLGEDTVRVKVWSPDGTIIYSDVGELIGKSFPLSGDIAEAFDGHAIVAAPDLTKPEYAHERDLPPLREFYIPVVGESGEVVSVFEVYRLYDHIDTTVSNIRGYVWLSVGIAVGLLGVFIAILILANGRAITRRQRLTAKLFGDLVQSQAEERTRIIGSMHDDIGQTLYRIHYGLEDMKSRVDGSDPSMSQDLDHVGALVSRVDQTLRTELRLLQYGTGEELALRPALDELAEMTEMESGLTVSVDVNCDCEPSATGRVALFRAAREAVTNVRKHAYASSVQIQVDLKASKVRLSVVDDGIGVDEDEGLGLTTTRERLEAIGGGLRVKTDRGGGTKFVAWVPADLESGEA